MAVHHQDQTAALDGPVTAPLSRIPQADLPTQHLSYNSGRPHENVPQRPDNHIDRCVGTVVHLALEELSREDTLPTVVGAGDGLRWRIALQQLGLWGELLNSAHEKVIESVTLTLADSDGGRWILASEHHEARSEWALMQNDGDSTRKLVIDRCFVDSNSGDRWIIDYKNSAPLPGESFDIFAAREGAAYQEQLRGYRDAVRQLGDQSVQCALYFTSQGRLHVLEDLRLPQLSH
jgi:ATP-dependent exoDNAse (exonuclease V) beta subunit